MGVGNLKKSYIKVLWDINYVVCLLIFKHYIENVAFVDINFKKMYRNTSVASKLKSDFRSF